MSEKDIVTLRLDSQANIAEVLSDPVGLTAHVEIGAPFARLAAQGSLAKALSFVTEIHKNGNAFDWEFNVKLGDRIVTFHFTGGKIDTQTLVVAATDGSAALRFYEEMMRMNNEQVNALRRAYSEIQRSHSLYDESSRLNNELVDTQRELAKKNAELRQLNKEKNRFLGIAAHDLRNPLHAILLLSEFLADEIQDEEQRGFLAEIRSSTLFMARLIDDLLDVAKIESGQVLLDYAPVDMNAVTQESVERNRLLASRKQVEIDFDRGGIPSALLDRTKIDQVLNNLITNAVKFSREGSRVAVRLYGAGDNFVLEVQDQGIGIPPEVQERLFIPFQKGQAGTAGEKSSGLGLVIVKRIVEGHGGSIRFASAVGTGTTFIVSIPYAPGAASQSSTFAD